MSEIISKEFLAIRLCFSPMLIPTFTDAERVKFCESCLRKVKQNLIFVVPCHFTTVGDIIRTITEYYYVPGGVDLTAEGFHLDGHLPVKVLKQISGPIIVTPLRKIQAQFRCLGGGACLDTGFTLQELADAGFDPPGMPGLPLSSADDSGFEEYETRENDAEDITIESSLTPESTSTPTDSQICSIKREVDVDNEVKLPNGKRQHEPDIEVEKITAKKGRFETAISTIAGALKRAFEAIAGKSEGAQDESLKRIKLSKPLLFIKSVCPEEYAKQLHWTPFPASEEIKTDAVLKLKIRTKDGNMEEKIVVVDKVNEHCISGKVIPNTGKGGEITVERSAIEEIRTWMKSDSEDNVIGID